MSDTKRKLKTYHLTVEQTDGYVYEISATSQKEAKEKFYNGDDQNMVCLDEDLSHSRIAYIQEIKEQR